MPAGTLPGTVVVALTLLEEPPASEAVATLASGVSAAVMMLSTDRYHWIVDAGALVVPRFVTVAVREIDSPSLADFGPETAVIVRSTGRVEVVIWLPARALLFSLVSMMALPGSAIAPIVYVPVGSVAGIEVGTLTIADAPPARAGTAAVATSTSVLVMRVSLDR